MHRCQYNKTWSNQDKFPAGNLNWQNVKTCRRAIITRPPWSDDREAQTKRTSGIGDDEPLDDERFVSSPESHFESRVPFYYG